MPRIFDNINDPLLSALTQTLKLSERADFCVGYFNLRGWGTLDNHVEKLSGENGNHCRLLIGMQRLPQDDLQRSYSVFKDQDQLDNQTASILKKQLAEDFRTQLTYGVPTNEDEAGLQRLAEQLRSGKLAVKLYLRHPLHAKLYLFFRQDPINPITGYVGSSNLTLAGLSHQGELNVDVVDNDAAVKLAKWFQDRWDDRWCVDISKELIEIIEQSWAGNVPILPYHIYIKMAYHLSQEARAGLSEFKIPSEFGNTLLEYQTAAVKIASHHMNKRGGVLIGDVVGLGKTLMATAIAKIYQDDQYTETLIICPKNLVDMWEDYVVRYRLLAKVIPITRVITELPSLRRYKVVLIDESQNLRNRMGKRYKVIQEYIYQNESKCILLSATPYNKTYEDLSSQLRLFIPEDKDLGMRPEHLINELGRELGETEFLKRHQCPIRSIAAFEKSTYADDWRELMRLYMVRRTRSFIKNNYALKEGKRCYLTLSDGTKSYFPDRVPQTIKFDVKEGKSKCQYSKLYAADVVDTINSLKLPRYGLGNYIAPTLNSPPTPSEATQIGNLSRAGKRLMGFCRTSLFKRLESSGEAFYQSIERHILRNHIFIYAVKNGLPVPIGTQDSGLLDAGNYDEDIDDEAVAGDMDDDNGGKMSINAHRRLRAGEEFHERAADVYKQYCTQFKSRFSWLRADLFTEELLQDLESDADQLMRTLNHCGDWDANKDTKLDALYNLITKKHSHEKIIVFTQFADTVHYLEEELTKRGVKRMAGVTGEDESPTVKAWRFSPNSNDKKAIAGGPEELRVLIATDVLSEGQNLQDAHIIVNFDLPWAIIRLIQRAGRVDRIGQKSEKILCYSFLPADGVEKLINLRGRVRERLKENAEVVGTDEAFFEDENEKQMILDLYNEKSGILDGDSDTEVDLGSYAYQIWKNAIVNQPELEKIITQMPSVVYSTRMIKIKERTPPGVLIFIRTPDGNDALAWVNIEGKIISEAQFEILKAAECSSDTPALPRQDNHHQLVKKGVEHVVTMERTVGGQLGRPSGARFKTYERLKRYAQDARGIYKIPGLDKAIEEIYKYPMRQSAIDKLNRQLRLGIDDMDLAALVMALRDDDMLCIVHEKEQIKEPQLICSLGLVQEKNGGKK